MIGEQMRYEWFEDQCKPEKYPIEQVITRARPGDVLLVSKDGLSVTVCGTAFEENGQ